MRSVGLCLLFCGCAATEAPKPVAAPVDESGAGSAVFTQAPSPKTATTIPAETSPTNTQRPAADSTTKKDVPFVPSSDPKDILRAKKLVEKGVRLYHVGEYDAAETTLKEAMTIYPFLAEANLTMGKILLVKGSATRDRSLIDSSRLMFEMARALDPSLKESELLLDLFHHASNTDP